jgi:hypothetical protein
MITVIALWERTQLEPELELSMWRQLKGAFKQGDSSGFQLVLVPILDEMRNRSVVQCETIDEALQYAQGPVCFLEPTGKKNMVDLAALPGVDLTIVLGNACRSNINLAGDRAYRIDTPQPTDLYGINAAAIALSHWWYGRK